MVGIFINQTGSDFKDGEMRIFLLLCALLVSIPATAMMIHYDYTFDYYDISGCSVACAPEAKQGAGYLVVDGSNQSLVSLVLTSADFDLVWGGMVQFVETDRWTVPGGDLYSLAAGFNTPQYNVQFFLDLFYVPEGGIPVDYLANVGEDFNTLETGDTLWNLHGVFEKIQVASVPAPPSLLLFIAGLLGLGWSVGVSRIWKGEL